jgi:hypothetical protein
LQLVNPKVVDASPFYLRLAYDASLRGISATAFCEIAYPHRLRWPILGRMIEMSINTNKETENKGTGTFLTGEKS